MFGVRRTCFSLVAVFSNSFLSTKFPIPTVNSLTPSVFAKSVSAIERLGDDVGSFVIITPIFGADGLPCSRNICRISFIPNVVNAINTFFSLNRNETPLYL